MKIRSVTYFDHPGYPLKESFINRAETFVHEVQKQFKASDIEVQSVRFASPPFPIFLQPLSADQVIAFAVQLENQLNDLGFEYLSLGPALPKIPESFELVSEIIQNTNNTFCSGSMTLKEQGVSLPAVRACGKIIEQLSPIDPNGFTNLYFAALGNVPAGSPFFPAAYHDQNGPPAFAFALEGADLAVSAFSGASSFEEARKRLIEKIESINSILASLSTNIERSTGATYQGIDCSLAPFPDPSLSLGAALEELGLKQVGLQGSLAAATFLADTIDRANFQRTGFSGLMLPVLEDSVLAKRAAEGVLSIKDLLLYSAVCGTGLDTVPLPGNTTADQISSVLMDLAALSLRLDKPLTARLMPIPGKKAEDETNFDFPFFANSKVMDIKAKGLSGIFNNQGFLDIQPRTRE